MLTMKTQDGNWKKIAWMKICHVLLLCRSNNENEIIDWTIWTGSRPATWFSWWISVYSRPLSVKERGGGVMVLLAQTLRIKSEIWPKPVTHHRFLMWAQTFLTLTFTPSFRDANTETAEGWYQARFPFDNRDLGIGYVVKDDIESPLRVSASIPAAEHRSGTLKWTWTMTHTCK